MRHAAVLLVLLAACHGASPGHMTPAQLSLRIIGDVNPDSMPPSCRAHGGSPPVQSKAPIWQQNAQSDAHLDSLGFGRISVHLLSARTGQPLSSAVILLEPAPPRGLGATTSSDGWARIQARAGRYRMRIRSIAVNASLDSVSIRRGYADTLKLEVGQAWLCGL